MARLIKRYENRKLYDTEASEYVSLSDIANLVRSGDTVRVVDNATGRDLTAQTLTQIILEEGKRGTHAIPSDILHQLLRRSEEAIDVGFEQLRSTVDDLVQSSFGRLRRLVQGPHAEELEELRGQLQSLEQQLATLLGDLEDRDAAASNSESASGSKSDSNAPHDKSSVEENADAPGVTS
jgi:polyhydroxyalkanoate synthesis repressor PhaR